MKGNRSVFNTCPRKDKIMYGICTVTFNIKAFLGLKIGRGGASGGRGRRRIERMGRKKKQENTNSEKEDVTK